jgi:hypothetical protein
LIYDRATGPWIGEVDAVILAVGAEEGGADNGLVVGA